MNIREKTLGVIAFSLLVSASVNYFILRQSVWPSFVELEQQETIRDIDRVAKLIKAEIEDVSAGLWDYSSWDDTYAYAKGENPEFPETYLATDPLINMGMDVIEVYDTDDRRLYQVVFDRKTGQKLQVPWSLHSLDAEKTLFSHADEKSSISGIIASPRGPLLIASRPIVKTSGEGPTAGTFFFGRFLDDRLVESLREKAKVDFRVFDLANLAATADQKARDRMQQSGESVLIDEISDQQITAYRQFEDYLGTPILLLKADIARDITSIGREALLASVAGVVLAGFVIMTVTGGLLQWMLVGPLVQLTEHVVAVGASDSLSRRLESNRRDEIGILSREFDKMLANVKEARDRLLESSYRSGIAEMASGVLHNLRNQLTPLSMRVDRTREEISPLDESKVDLALGELTSDTTEAEKKGKFAQFISLCFKNAEDKQTKIRRSLTEISQDIRRIEAVFRELDRFSHAEMEIEEVLLADVVDRAVSTLPTFEGVHFSFDIDHDLQTFPPVRSAGFVLKQVLNNLFVNAMESIIASGRTDGHITVTGEIKELDARSFVDLRIQDNGAGIPSENLQRIFLRGFSTKEREPKGYGLHWSANSVSAMQGKLYAESPGENEGATLHVLLPVADAISKAAA